MSTVRSTLLNTVRSTAKPLTVAGSSGGSVPDPTKLMIVAFGESNSGGYALNSDAPSWELAIRDDINFWNVNTSVFENMDIGTNNNLDHYGLNSTTHGWELGIANAKRQGFFNSLGVYYVQTGQGGSKVSEWNVGGDYWTKFLARTSAAKTAAGNPENIAVLVSLGINDAIAETTKAAFKSGLSDILGRIKTQLPGCKIFIDKLPAVNAFYTDNSAAIDEIVAADSSNLRSISTIGLDMRDTNHRSYVGMKGEVMRFIDAMRSDYSLATGMAWSAYGDANSVVPTAINQHSYYTTTIDATSDFAVYYESFGSASDGQVLAIDDDINAVNWAGGSDDYIIGAFTVTGVLSWTTGNGIQTGFVNPNFPVWVRMAKVGNNGVVSSSEDGGATWTTRYTRTDAFLGKTTARLKTLTAVGASRIFVWRQ